MVILPKARHDHKVSCPKIFLPLGMNIRSVVPPIEYLQAILKLFFSSIETTYVRVGDAIPVFHGSNNIYLRFFSGSALPQTCLTTTKIVVFRSVGSFVRVSQ